MRAISKSRLRRALFMEACIANAAAAAETSFNGQPEATA
jgi:hypothetical protein